ncbi:MAG: VOC family protein [Chitinophaga sp.]|uniref:VOC family protein n=1 Tax=Chitinophaga sp. TaxID=1869181 RepID=UPI001B0A1F01|nr:VOC family protein [Chitinophaga sp.]MBO9730081.1 VOC family protein [Chitinophaga sp.]
MHLNHLNLTVKDVPATRTFFETYFNFRCTDPKLNDSLSVLTGPDGFLLVLMNQRFNDKENHTYPDAFHIGFYLDNQEAVMAMYQRLQDGGIVLEQAPQPMRKTFGFYMTFDSIMIEITTPVKE